MKSDLLELLKAAVDYSRNGQSDKARRVARQVVTLDPRNEQAWLLLAYLAQTVEDRRAMLWKVMTINPEHPKAKDEFLKLITPGAIQRAARKGIFISYARTDEVFVGQVTDDLRALDIPVWLDIIDIPHGVDWDRATNEALEHCGLMLAIVSPAALRTENVRNEIRNFMSAGKIILPVRFKSCDPEALGLWIEPVDFSVDYQTGLKKLVSLLAVAPAPAYQ